MSKITDFLTPDNDQIRHQIKGILKSYSHEWDLLAELTQNSVDAIRASDVEKGRIELTFDASARKIAIRDNGTGIDPKKIKKLLRPFGTDKDGKPNQIGEMGVGLKFVIFSSASFLLESNGAKGACTARIDDAAAWVSSASAEPLELDLIETASNGSHGTLVEAVLSAPDHPLLDYSFEDLIFLLRTKTAIGDTGFIWEQPLNCDITFVYYDRSGKKSSRAFDCRYLLPIEPLKGSGVEELDAFEKWLKDGDRSDQEKRRKLLNKIVWTKGKKFQGGREIGYWSCFVPRREFWQRLSSLAGVTVDGENAESPVEQHPGVGFSGGFQTATKGMPTGIAIELKPRGSAGYVPNFFVLVDDPSLHFDIGRKFVHGKQQGFLRQIAYENFREYINNVRKYLGGDIDTETGDWDRDETFAEVDGLPNLNSEKSRFVKRPNAQEATVAGMFFEQIGRGEFAEVSPLISGYKERYDLYARWKNRRVVIEFKYDLNGLLNDFDEEKKMFNEINVVVLWELTEEDRRLAARRGMTIEPVQTTPLVEHQVFPHANHRLSLGDVTPIYVVEMRRIVDAS
ncbi:MAG: ATP-binding protein [Terracidiphilus sp.]